MTITSVTVVLQPTIHKDPHAMGRLMDVLISKLDLSYPDIARAVLSIAETVKANSRANLTSEIRFSSDGTAQVLSQSVTPSRN